jgi:ABC-type branched-subunit amino acid transport system substrate-binding protein
VRAGRLAILIVGLAAGLIACAPPRAMGRLALAAPFEGRERAIGYGAFPAMRLALREGLPAAPIDFIAFNDDGEPAVAARVAADIARDPTVLVVIGHGALSTTLAALPVYAAAGLPIIVIGALPDALPIGPGIFALSPSQATLDACARSAGRPCAEGAEPGRSAAIDGALAAFADVSGGAPPTRRSSVALDATRVAIASIREAARGGSPTRASVAAALANARVTGVLGEIRFDRNGRWPDAPASPLSP